MTLAHKLFALGADFAEDASSANHRRRFARVQTFIVAYEESRALEQRVWRNGRTTEQIAADEAKLAELERQFAAELAEEKRKRRAERLAAYALPLDHGDIPLLVNETLRESRAVKATRTWLAGKKPLLVLSGTTGVGKTLASADALMRVDGRYTRAGAFSRLFLASFGDEVTAREELINSAGLLVIDDIGTEQRSDLMAIALLETLDARRAGDCCNLWVTNLSRGDFEARYPDERLHSRMAQSAMWLIDSGDDLRRAK